MVALDVELNNNREKRAYLEKRSIGDPRRGTTVNMKLSVPFSHPARKQTPAGHVRAGGGADSNRITMRVFCQNYGGYQKFTMVATKNLRFADDQLRLLTFHSNPRIVSFS